MPLLVRQWRDVFLAPTAPRWRRFGPKSAKHIDLILLLPASSSGIASENWELFAISDQGGLELTRAGLSARKVRSGGPSAIRSRSD